VAVRRGWRTDSPWRSRCPGAGTDPRPGRAPRRGRRRGSDASAPRSLPKRIGEADHLASAPLEELAQAAAQEPEQVARPRRVVWVRSRAGGRRGCRRRRGRGARRRGRGRHGLAGDGDRDGGRGGRRRAVRVRVGGLGPDDRQGGRDRGEADRDRARGPGPGSLATTATSTTRPQSGLVRQDRQPSRGRAVSGPGRGRAMGSRLPRSAQQRGYRHPAYLLTASSARWPAMSSWNCSAGTGLLHR
jgi:hypothetical protein